MMRSGQSNGDDVREMISNTRFVPRGTEDAVLELMVSPDGQEGDVRPRWNSYGHLKMFEMVSVRYEM